MSSRFRCMVFVSVLSVFFCVMAFSGFNQPVNAQDAPPAAAKKECPLGSKGDKPQCSASSGGGAQNCCKSASGSLCDKKAGGCKSGGGHTVSDMVGLVHCAKKKLLIAKIEKKLQKQMGKKLDKVADLLIDAMLEEYKAGRLSSERDAELNKQLIEIFSGKGSK